MHRNVDVAIDQRAFQLFGPQGFAADIGQRAALILVARRQHRDQLHSVRRPTMRRAQRGFSHLRLSQSERGGASANTERGEGPRGPCGLSIARHSRKGKRMAIILGLESSCDETAAAIVRSDRAILSHALAGQEDHHRAFGGVVPEIAARAHAEMMTPLVKVALADAGMTLDDVDAIAATAGPGLIGGVMVGLVTAKALAMAAGKPLIAVNHLEGHALSP